jgi:hypothetical protein
VEKLETLLPNVLILRKNIVIMKKPTTRKNIKRANPNKKRNSIRKIKKFILKRIVAHLTSVKMMIQWFYLWEYKLKLAPLNMVIMKMKKI